MRTTTSIGLTEGREIGEHILDVAGSDGLPPVAICIVDAHGHLVWAATMDGTKTASIATAHAKAVTAVMFARDTMAFHHTLGVSGWTDENGDGPWESDPDGWTDIDVAQAAKINPVFCSWGGGSVILSPHDGSILGGVGISNRTEEQDHELASQRPSGWSA